MARVIILWMQIRCVLSIGCLSLATTAINAAEEHASTGVRAIGMGEAFIAVTNDENGVRRNPAGLARLDRYAVGFERTPSQLFNALETNYLSAVLPTSEKLALGLDWLQVGIEDEELDAKRHHLNFSYSYAPLSRLSLGVNLKYLTWSIALDGQSKGGATGWGTDFGVLFQPNRRWTVGFLAQDFIGFGSGAGLSRGTSIRHDSNVSEKIAPTAYKLGVAYRPSPTWLIATDITDRLHLGAEFSPDGRFAIRAGVQKDWHTAEPPTYSFGGSARYRWMNFNIAYAIPPTLPSTVYAGLSLNFDFRKLPVRIEQVRMRDLYPVHYHYYAKPNRDAEIRVLEASVTPPVFTEADLNRYYPLLPEDVIGRIWLKNESPKPMSVRVKLFMDEFVSKGGTEVASEIIPPLARISVPMRQLVLSRKTLELTQSQPVEAQIQIIESGGTAYRTSTVTFVLHDNHTTILDDVAKLASFISSEGSTENSAIRAFIDEIRAEFREEIRATDMPSNLYEAMLLFNALHGISYAPDPNIPRESGTIDEIKHPHEMLEQLMGQNPLNGEAHIFGDCDDSTVLYCSLLESAGIKTALIQLPSHVMMAFELGRISLSRAQEMKLPEGSYQSINGQVWIPIETTLIRAGFAAAWNAASEAIQSAGAVSAVVPVEEAWEKYGESGLRGTPFPFSIPKDKIQKRMEADLADSWIQGFLNAL